MSEEVRVEAEPHFWGVIRPMGRRWNWPFSRMNEGDWFLVNVEEYEAIKGDIEKLRSMAAVRASQLGCGFPMTKDDPENPGFAKVVCTPYGSGKLFGKPKKAKPALKYDEARDQVMDAFGINIDELALAQTEVEDVEAEPVFVEDNAPERIVFTMASATLGMEQVEGKLRFVRLPEGWTLRVWEKRYEEWKAARVQIDRSMEQKIFAQLKLEAVASSEELRESIAKRKLEAMKADPALWDQAVAWIEAQEIEAIMS